MRISTIVVLYIILMSVFTGMFDTAGVWDDWGVEIDTGVDEQVNETQKTFKQVQTGGLGAQTLIGMFLTVYNTLKTAYTLVTAAPTVLQSVGVPTFLTLPIKAVMFIIVGRDILGAWTGREI